MIERLLDHSPALASPAAPGDKGATPGTRELEALGARLQRVFGERFHVLQPVAIGGMATVFQMRHTGHHGLFAAKVLHPELTARPDVLESFRTEAIHGALLAGHPSVVPIFDFAQVDGLFFLVMPWVEGEDLDQILRRRGCLGRADALLLTAQVSSLLCHAEANGIVHGDLTPGNLRLDGFGNYRVLDFGLSHTAGADADRTLLGGTPLYLSPEQAAGRPTDIRSDLYSLGVILFEALTGIPLYAAETLEQLAEKRRQSAWQFPVAIQEDEGLAKLLVSLLANDPEERMPSAFALAGAMEAFGFKRPEFRDSLRPAAPPGPRRRRLSAE